MSEFNFLGSNGSSIRNITPYSEAFNLCYSWERLLYRILSPLFYPAHNRDWGCLLDGVALPAISSSIPRRTTMSVLWFPTRAFYFSIAKVGQASCCKGRSPYLARKSFKDFGVQLLLDPNSLASSWLKFLSAISWHLHSFSLLPAVCTVKIKKAK